MAELDYLKMKLSDEEKFKHSRYLLQAVVPFLKQFNQEQMLEKEIEAKIQGTFPSGSYGRWDLEFAWDATSVLQPIYL